jgi:hypothetical protein
MTSSGFLPQICLCTFISSGISDSLLLIGLFSLQAVKVLTT